MCQKKLLKSIVMIMLVAAICCSTVAGCALNGPEKEQKEKILSLCLDDQFDAALPLIEALAADYPADLDVFDFFVIVYREKKEYDKLLSYIDQQIQRYPNELHFQSELIETLPRIKRYDELLTMTDTIIERNSALYQPYDRAMFEPETYDEQKVDAFALCIYAQYMKGRALEFFKRNDEAREVYLRILPYANDSFVGYRYGLYSYYSLYGIADALHQKDDAIQYAQDYLLLEKHCDDCTDRPDHIMYESARSDIALITAYLRFVILLNGIQK